MRKQAPTTKEAKGQKPPTQGTPLRQRQQLGQEGLKGKK